MRTQYFEHIEIQEMIRHIDLRTVHYSLVSIHNGIESKQRTSVTRCSTNTRLRRFVAIN